MYTISVSVYAACSEQPSNQEQAEILLLEIIENIIAEAIILLY
jgi:hypothetical protein